MQPPTFDFPSHMDDNFDAILDGETTNLIRVFTNKALLSIVDCAEQED